MTWIYVPSTCLPSVQESEDSTSGSESPSPEPELYVTLSGKQQPRPLSWRGWRRRPWIRLLSGTTSTPSTAARGVERWISSLRASRAPRSPSPASEAGSKTTAGCGRPSSASFAKFNPDGSFSRTSLDLFQTDEPLDGSSVDWPRWGSMRNGVCSARKAWVPPTSGNGCSSSRGGSPWDRNSYPTPSATPYGTSQNEGQVPHDRPTKGTPSLETGMRSWPTPTSHERTHTPRDVDHGAQLANDAANWPTPGARDWKDVGNLPPRTEGVGVFAERKDQLPRVAQGWPTPKVSDWKGADPAREENRSGARHQGDGLATTAPNWPTPRVAQSWPSPNTKGSDSAARHTTDPEGAMNPGTTLTDASRSFPPVLTTSTCGPECSPKHPGSSRHFRSPRHLRLNPRFVEWLMGLPDLWSQVR